VGITVVQVANLTIRYVVGAHPLDMRSRNFRNSLQIHTDFGRFWPHIVDSDFFSAGANRPKPASQFCRKRSFAVRFNAALTGAPQECLCRAKN
jgi:hypothetical protein